MTSSPCSALVTDPIFLWVQPHPPVVAQLCNPFRLSCKYHAFQICTDHTNRLIDQKNLPIVRRLIAVARARDVASYFRTDSPYTHEVSPLPPVTASKAGYAVLKTAFLRDRSWLPSYLTSIRTIFLP